MLRESGSGGLLVVLLILSLLAEVTGVVSPVWAGGAGWLAGAVLARRLTGAARWQVLAMLTLGILGLIWGAANGAPSRLVQALSANHLLLAMLVGVTFLRLVAMPRTERHEALPVGRRALWRTLLGVHFFGAVINLSALLIMAERQSLREPLSRLQAIVLSRGFSAAAYWSPFFAAMGVALTYAAGSNIQTLTLMGLPAALGGLAITGLALSRSEEARTFRGYPIHFEALLVPGLLALAVLLLHELWPGIKVLVWVALLSPALSIGLLVRREGRAAAARLKGHVTRGLPQMSGELILFLAAGVFAAGVGSVADTLELTLGAERVGARGAAAMLAIMVLLAAFGVHPVISISVIGGVLADTAIDPNLLGMVFLMGWSLGVCISPLSAMHLAMQGRFGVPSFQFLRWNYRYILVMWCVDALLLYLYTHVAGA
ncbi:MAG: hypothetical protein Kow006_10040 [Gammaproteobacteria bacterium]